MMVSEIMDYNNDIINMLLDTEIKVANLLPAILIPFLYYPIVQLF